MDVHLFRTERENYDIIRDKVQMISDGTGFIDMQQRYEID